MEAVAENLLHENFDEIIEKVNSAGLNWKAGTNFNSNYQPKHISGKAIVNTRRSSYQLFFRLMWNGFRRASSPSEGS